MKPLTILFLCFSTFFLNAQLSWTPLPSHNSASIKMLFITSDGDYIGLTPFDNQMVYSTTKGRSWEALSGQQNWITFEEFFFVEDETNTVYFTSDGRGAVYSIDKQNYEILEHSLSVVNKIGRIEAFEILNSGDFVVVGNRGISLVNSGWDEVRTVDFWHHSFKILLMDSGPHILVVSNGATYQHYLFNEDLTMCDLQGFSIGSPRDVQTDGEVIYGRSTYSRDRINWMAYPENLYLSDLHVTKDKKLLAFSSKGVVFSPDQGRTIVEVNDLDGKIQDSPIWISGIDEVVLQEASCQIGKTFRSSNGELWEEITKLYSTEQPYSRKIGVSSDGVVYNASCYNLSDRLRPMEGQWAPIVHNNILGCSGYKFVVSPTGNLISDGCYSLDGGDTWKSSTGFHGLYDLHLVNDRIYTGDYVYYVSEDFGMSWEYFDERNPFDVFGEQVYITAGENIIEFVDDSVTFQTRYWQRRDRMGNVEKIDIPEETIVISMDVGYANSNVVLHAIDNMQNHVVGVSEDEGDNFQYYAVPKAVENTASDVYIDHLDNIFIYSEEEVFLSQNLGVDWEDITPNYPSGPVEITGVLTGWDGHVYISSNGQPIYKSSEVLGQPKILKAKVYEDENFNCKYDSGEELVSNIAVTRGRSKKFSDEKGEVTFLVREDRGKVELDLNSLIHSSCSNSQSYDFNNLNELDVYLPVNTTAECAILEMGASTPRLRRCFTNSYTIELNNRGNVPAEDVVLKIELDSFFEFISCSWQVIDRQGRTMVFNLPEIDPGERLRGSLVFKLSCDAALGQEHYFTLSAEASNECEPLTAATFSTECQPNIGSYDPNDKADFVGGILHKEIIAREDQLEYRIRFENTGTDTAFNIRIEDPISGLLDLSSVRPTAASHDYSWEINEGSLIINFDNIMLPDTGTNKEAAQGFIKLVVDVPEEVEPGTEISNVAAIFFDFNDPIITNRTKNYYLCKDTLISLRDTICIGDTLFGYTTTGFYVEELKTEHGCDSLIYLNLTVLDSTHYRCWISSNHDLTSDQLEIFPNPTSDVFSLKFGEKVSRTIQVFNMDGVPVLRFDSTSSIEEIDATDFPVGMYMILVEQEGGVKRSGRLVKM